MDELSPWSGLIQGGFAGFCVLLLGFCVWLIRSILRMSRDTQEVVRANTEAITKQIDCLERVVQHTEESHREVRRLRFLLESRPCLYIPEDHAPEEDGKQEKVRRGT